MSICYLSAPAMEVNRINLIAGSGVLSLTPVTAAVLFSEAFRVHLVQSEGVAVEPQGTLYVHHHARPFQETLFNKTGASYHSSCRITGATQFNANDRASGSKGPSNSDQPLALGFAKVSLILRVETQDVSDNDLLRSFQRFVYSKARFAGGEIVKSGSIEVFRDLASAIESIGASGYVVTDRSDLVQRDRENNPGKSRAKALLDTVLEKHFETSDSDASPQETPNQKEADGDVEALDEEDNANTLEEGAAQGDERPSRKITRKRRSLACLGYSLLSEPKPKRHARNDLPHAYGEAMTGVVEFMPLRELRRAMASDDTPFDEQCLLWRYSWPTPDIFRVHQPETNEARYES